MPNSCPSSKSDDLDLRFAFEIVFLGSFSWVFKANRLVRLASRRAA